MKKGSGGASAVDVDVVTASEPTTSSDASSKSATHGPSVITPKTIDCASSATSPTIS